MLATIDSAYDGPALFCISAIFALSFGSMPINFIHGLANSAGEYHTKPTTIVATAHTSTAHRFTPRKCMEVSIQLQIGFGSLCPVRPASARECTRWSRKIHLLRQPQPSYQGLVSWIGTDGVKRGIAEAEHNFNFLGRNRFLQIIERAVPVARDRKSHSCPGVLFRLIECAERQIMKTLRVAAPRSRRRSELF